MRKARGDGPKPFRDLAYAEEKRSIVVVAAIARELSGFIWAIGRAVTPARRCKGAHSAGSSG